MKTTGYAAQNAQAPLAPFSFDRREPRANDVVVEILYTGVCHSDLHMARDHWAPDGWASTFPIVPGHEIVGRVIGRGKDVSGFEDGDLVAVGCMVDSCQHCDKCHAGEEQLCRKGMVLTYNGRDPISGENTYGGYSRHIVVRKEFLLRVPEGLDLKRAAPLLCAGITTYSPLRRYGAGPGKRVGVIGLGGLGHLAVKFAAALGADVTGITRSEAKAKELHELGADHVLISSSQKQLEAAHDSFDLIIDTIPVGHDLTPYLPLLDHDGTLVIVGALAKLDGFSSLPLIMGRRHVTGSPIGGIAQTQEMLNLAAKKNILPDCEMIKMQDINTAFDRMEKGDVHYRFVIDMASLS